MEIDDIIGTVYSLSEVSRDHAGAISLLRTKAEDAEIGAALKAKMYGLRDIVQARTVGRYCGCHVSKVCLELLAEALSPQA